MIGVTSFLTKFFVWSVIYKLIKKIVLWFLIISVGLVLLFKFIPVPFTFFMIQRLVVQKMDGEEMKLKKDWVSMNEISQYAQLSVVCAEDQNFLNHSGFDFKAIKKAYDFNEKMEEKGKSKRRGASTISQQTAKNVFLWHGRSWIRKGFEVYFTFLIETLWSKKRILEVYLNVVELGNGIYGVEAASNAYFKKSAAKLTPSEAALLAVILPNPRVYSASRPSGFIKKRQNWCLRQMKHWGMKLDFEQNNKTIQEEEEE